MKFKIRKPQLRITKKGVRLTNVGATIGGKHARLNVGRKGVSTSVGTRGASLNTRRGLTLSPWTLLKRLFGRK